MKLQRNALHILEAPAGAWDFGDDNDTEYEGGLPTSRSDGLSGAYTFAVASLLSGR